MAKENEGPNRAERLEALLATLRKCRREMFSFEKQFGVKWPPKVMLRWTNTVAKLMLELFFTDLGEEPPEVEDKPVIYMPTGPGGGLGD